MEAKKWYKSKTVWVTGVAFVAALLQAFGVIAEPVSAETQVTIISAIAFILRFVTKEAIEW